MSTTEKRLWTIVEKKVQEQMDKEQFQEYCEEYIDFECCCQNW